jgi:hypothetical protein
MTDCRKLAMLHSPSRPNRASSFGASLLAVVLVAGCADPEDIEDAPDATVGLDASTGTPDGGVEDPDGGFRVQSLNLQPAGGEARSAEFQVKGGLVPAAGTESTSDRHRLRGRLGILAP